MDNKKDISKKVWEKIEKENIKPKPKWQFLVRNYFLWIFGGFFAIVTALVFALVFSAIKSNDWDFYLKANTGVGFFLKTMPFLWIFLAGVFGFVVYVNFKSTKKGYKYSFGKIAGAVFLASLLFGGVLFLLGFAEFLESRYFNENEIYQKYFCPNVKFWHQPENGVMAGVVSGEATTEKIFSFVDVMGKKWQIDFSGAAMDSGISLSNGEKLKVAGEQTGESSFTAKEIRLIHCGCGMENCQCSGMSGVHGNATNTCQMRIK